MKLTATVREGKLIADPVAWTIAMRQYEGTRVHVEIETEKKLRSLRANNRYFGVIVPLAGDLLSKTRDVPLSKDQVHYILKSAFLGCEETPLGMVPMDSRTLDSKQFAAYTEKVSQWLASQGYYVPEPGEAIEVS